MNIFNIVLKLLQCLALVSIIVTCSVANRWMENDNVYQSYYYNLKRNEIQAELAMYEAKVRREEAEDAANATK